jgi:DnaK suppressor protein
VKSGLYNPASAEDHPEHLMAAKKPSAKPTKAKKTASEKPVATHASKGAGKPVGKEAVKAAAPARVPHAPVGTVEARKAAPQRKVPPPQLAEPDDAESTEIRPNLLAGPRNVQPYVPRKGEEYMNKEQLEHFRLILSSWKQDLMQEVDRTVLHMKDEAANFPDPNDRATQESEFSLELRTRDRERKLIRKIDEALKRIEDGSYGFCMETGEPIGVKRLEARPVATLSVEAQERRERREKQFGDRDDWYR